MDRIDAIFETVILSRVPSKNKAEKIKADVLSDAFVYEPLRFYEMVAVIFNNSFQIFNRMGDSIKKGSNVA